MAENTGSLFSSVRTLGVPPGKERLVDLNARRLFSRNLRVLQAVRGLVHLDITHYAGCSQGLIGKIKNLDENPNIIIYERVVEGCAIALNVSVDSLLTKDFQTAIEQRIAELDTAEV